jgi:hypothetical protein
LLLGALKDFDGLSEAMVVVEEDALHVEGFGVVGIAGEGPA